MSAPRQLRRALKSVGRDWLPPVVARGLRKLMVRNPPVGAPLGVASRHKDSTVLNNGTTLHHRDSSADGGVIHQIFSCRDYDLSVLERYDEIAQFYESCPDPLILDCGANIGAAGVWFSQIFPKASICAVEPERSNFKLLQKNCSERKFRLVEGAVAASRGSLQLVDPGEGEWGFRTGALAGEMLYDVEAYAVADLLDICPGTPFILKVDVEGAEADVFASGGDVLDRFPVVIVELHDWMLPRSASSKTFLQWHAARDRDFVFRGENVFSLSNVSLRRIA